MLCSGVAHEGFSPGRSFNLAPLSPSNDGWVGSQQRHVIFQPSLLLKIFQKWEWLRTKASLYLIEGEKLSFEPAHDHRLSGMLLRLSLRYSPMWDTLWEASCKCCVYASLHLLPGSWKPGNPMLIILSCCSPKRPFFPVTLRLNKLVYYRSGI